MKKIIRLTESDLAKIVKRVIKESKVNPERNCNWYITDTTLLDGVKGDLHMTERSKGIWILEKYNNPNYATPPFKKNIEVPPPSEIEVEWDDEIENIRLVGNGLKALNAYNVLFNTSESPESGKVLFTTDSYPSKYGIERAQYIIAAKIVVSKSEKPSIFPMELVKLKDGATAIFDKSIFFDRKMFKKEYYHLNLIYNENFQNSIRKCDPEKDPGRY